VLAGDVRVLLWVEVTKKGEANYVSALNINWSYQPYAQIITYAYFLW
jgi:hypothetical protein